MLKTNRNIFTFVIFVAFITVATINSVRAQTPTNTITTTVSPTTTVSQTTSPIPTITVTETPIITQTPSAPVSIRIEVGTQYPWNKRIPVTLYVTPTQSGEKLEIRWQKRTGLLASPLNIAWNSPKAGTTYKAEFLITPQSVGYQRAVADIIITTFNSNYVASQDLVLNLNSEKIVQPQSGTYLAYQIGMYIGIFLVFLVLLPFGLYKAFMYIKDTFIPRWLEAKLAKPQ